MMLRLIGFSLFALWTALPAAAAATPQRLRRADSFLGIHFDFHAGPDCNEVGKNTTREMVGRVVDLVHPDYLQIDCKGHPGLSSYPTRVGNRAPGIIGDPLRIWREVTAERGVALYMHYSGVWDSEAIARHPDWAARNAEGKPNPNAISFWSPYVDEVLIPQLQELAGDYGVDGAWVDGDCWASVPDYGEAAREAFLKSSGATELPAGRNGSRQQFEFMEYHREAFRRYVRHYVEALHRSHPDFQLCSNWAFSDHMPEPVSLPLDFLSGDYSSDDSVNSARMSARYLTQQGKPWDLMAWSFSQKARRDGDQGNSQKSAVQLEREAAIVLSMGGGFQAYFKQKRDGSIYDEQMPVMAEVARFCRDRQAFCHHARPVPQIALVFSTPAHYRRCSGLFSRDLSDINGTLQALLESQHSVEVLGEHHLAGRMQEYPLIIVPEWSYLESTFRTELVDYVRKGGHLLLIGPETALLFQSELGISAEGELSTAAWRLEVGDTAVQGQGAHQRFSLGAGSRAVGRLSAAEASGATGGPAAISVNVGQGVMVATTFGFSRGYLAGQSAGLRDFLSGLVDELFPEPMVEVTGSHDVDVALSRLQGRLTIHLVNTRGPHRSEGIIDSIAPVGPLNIRLRLPEVPRKVTSYPEGRELAVKRQGGWAELSLPELPIYEILVVE